MLQKVDYAVTDWSCNCIAAWDGHIATVCRNGSTIGIFHPSGKKYFWTTEQSWKSTRGLYSFSICFLTNGLLAVSDTKNRRIVVLSLQADVVDINDLSIKHLKVDARISDTIIKYLEEKFPPFSRHRQPYVNDVVELRNGMLAVSHREDCISLVHDTANIVTVRLPYYISSLAHDAVTDNVLVQIGSGVYVLRFWHLSIRKAFITACVV